MKIIAVDNFDRDTVSDVLIAENIQPYWAEKIMLLLNEKYSGGHADKFFKVVDNDYKLFEYNPD